MSRLRFFADLLFGRYGVLDDALTRLREWLRDSDHHWADSPDDDTQGRAGR
ncbi:hypothetical protein [Allonocardiopsis opalescens]|uniref:Uncharacterized protein n=1 Tax=Allonocardiopsis opalescens TaxID=1144618 RepID=A0A2T0PP58_9ACTN|nr:hypothetical protein [Allonocardiopsis opalescens]PRX90690.1 hypothetical protein CLV72_11828 [Allonocardiopsis opalescens]